MSPERAPDNIQPSKADLEGSSQRQDEKSDSDLVDWDGPNDPANPMNWPLKTKSTNCVIIAFYTFITYRTSDSLLLFFVRLTDSTVH